MSEAWQSRDEILAMFEGTNFGAVDKIDLVRQGLLKCACGYCNGHTLTCILIRLELITPITHRLTRQGKHALWAWFAKGLLK